MSVELIQNVMQYIYIFFQIIYIAILIRCFLSFLPLSRDNAFVNIIILVTEPILGPTRRLCQNSPLGEGGRIDFSPIIAIIFLSVLQRLTMILSGYILVILS